MPGHARCAEAVETSHGDAEIHRGVEAYFATEEKSAEAGMVELTPEEEQEECERRLEEVSLSLCKPGLAWPDHGRARR